jgi:hypothetical protein
MVMMANSDFWFYPVLLSQVKNMHMTPFCHLQTINKGKYTPRSYYEHKSFSLPDHHPSKQIWKNKWMSKHKFFAWLIGNDMINTKDTLTRRYWKVTYNNDCVLCQPHVLEDWKQFFVHLLVQFSDIELLTDWVEE